MKIMMIGDKILLKPHETPRETKSGIVMPSTYTERTKLYKVEAAGPQCLVKVGYDVIIPQNAGSKVKFDGNDYIIVKQSDILAFIEYKKEE